MIIVRDQSLKVKKMFPLINGIFHYINYQFPEEIEITDDQLDLLFISSWGMRIVAPVVLVLRDNPWDGKVLSEEELTYLGRLILNMYKYKWDKLAAILSLEYDPIHNYSDTFHEVIDEDGTHNDTVTHDTTVTDDTDIDIDKTVTDGGSERVVYSGQDSKTRTDDLIETVDGTGDNYLYGFNSEEKVGADSNLVHNTKLNEGTQTTAGTNSGERTTYGGLSHTTDEGRVGHSTSAKTGTVDTEGANTRDRVRDYTHLGNIGNITTQQLISEEIKLWHWNLINQVLNDVKDFLTIPVYE